MPELPEVESARSVIAGKGLGRTIVDVDDSDTYECRPHAPGQIRAALLGRRLTEAHRRGKSMWCDTSAVIGAAGSGSGFGSGSGSGSGSPGPVLGVHLGMSGKIVVIDRDGAAGVAETDGGDYWRRGRAAGDYRYTRFSLTFDDGGSLLLIDPRRLGRVRLDPPVEALGPDAREATRAQFRAAFAKGTAPVKARLLDQNAIAGVGNLLADEALWQAKINPARPVGELERKDVDRLHRALSKSIDAAVRDGGVHTLAMVSHRVVNGQCPRCGAPMKRATVGGRTTWWCSREQA